MAPWNSLLVDLPAGWLCQILFAEDALYFVRLGSLRDPHAPASAIESPDAFDPDRGWKLPREEIELVRIRAGLDQTEMCFVYTDGEQTCRMDGPIAPEALELFDGLNVIVEPTAEAPYTTDSLPLAGELPEEAPSDPDLPPGDGRVALAAMIMGGLAILLPLMWWIRPTALLFRLNLIVFPLGTVLLGRRAEQPLGRLTPGKALWLLPGLSLLAANIHLNLADIRQILLPAAGISALMALIYWALCRNVRRMAVILAACLLTYAPGAALCLNAFNGTTLTEARVVPAMIRPGWVEIETQDGRQRFFAEENICRQLRVGERCLLRLTHGAMGIDVWSLSPVPRTDEL